MKKTLRLTLLAAAAALVLTSCDAMLESLFPKDTIGDTSGAAGQNSIIVDVSGWDYYSSYYSMYYGWWGGYYSGGNGATYYPIHVQIYDQQGDQVMPDGSKAASTYTGVTVYFSSGGYGSARNAPTVTFSSLKDGTYRVKVWFDYDLDNSSANEQAGYNTWYYVDYGYVDSDSSTSSSVYLPKGGTTQSVTWYADLYEYPYYGY